jgi:U3 small nucleolar RNA-associated protein 12
VKNESRLITGCADSELRVWEIEYNNERNEESDGEEKKRKLTTQSGQDHSEDAEVNQGSSLSCNIHTDFSPFIPLSHEQDDKLVFTFFLKEILSCHLLGSVMRASTDRVVSLQSDPTGQYIGCHVSSS